MENAGRGGTTKCIASQTPPVLLWAAAGALMMTFRFYVLGNWVTGPNFKFTPPGADTFPDSLSVAA